MPDQPHWPDSCQHTEADDVFLGTTVDPATGDLLDVYLYFDRAFKRFQVCIRYGAEGREYYSPGDAEQFVARGAVLPAYGNPIEMIRRYWASKKGV